MANTDFSVLLKAVIDKAGVNTELQQVQQIVKKYSIELTPEFNKASLRNSLRSISGELARDLNKALGTNLSGNDVFRIFETQAKQAEAQMKKTAQEAQNLANQVKNIKSSMNAKGTMTTDVEVLRNGFVKLGLSTEDVKKKMGGLDAEMSKLKGMMQSNASDSAIVTQFQQVQNALAQTQNSLKLTRSEYSLMATEQQRLTLANTIEAWNQKNSAATKAVREQNERYIASLRELDVTMDRLSFNNIKNGFKQAENSMRGLGKLGASFRNQMKQAAQSFTQWFSVSTAVMTMISKTREAVSTLKEVNTLLTEVSKANDKLTKSQLEGIGDRSFETASRYGRKATDYLAGVQEMSRAGYQDAEAMGALSVKAQGAGAMTADVANSFIVATDKAYKLNGSLTDLTEVMDGINYITNHNAVNMTELSEGFSDLLEVEKVQKDKVVIRKNEESKKLEILSRIIEKEIDLEFFGLYEPSLNDIFVEKAGDE